MTILPATAADFDDVRRLFSEYHNSMGFTPCFRGLQEELDTLPGKYGPPRGALFIARNSQNIAVGTVALRPTDLHDTCEMKRLYVSPAARGTGLGARLLDTIFDAARERGYHHMRLDTIAGKMDRAIAMYRDAGFADIPPYFTPDFDGLVFLSKTL